MCSISYIYLKLENHIFINIFIAIQYLKNCSSPFNLLVYSVVTSHSCLQCCYITFLSTVLLHHILVYSVVTSHSCLQCCYITFLSTVLLHHILVYSVVTSHSCLQCCYITFLSTVLLHHILVSQFSLCDLLCILSSVGLTIWSPSLYTVS